MATRAQTKKTASTKKGLAPKRAKKLAKRKPTKTNRTGTERTVTPRNKRDAALDITHEAAANTPEARAARTRVKSRRVRASR
jgi:hypothetical protein